MSARYGVMFVTTANTITYVDADSPEDARDKADEIFEAPWLCAQCSGWGNDQNLELGEFEADDTDGGVFLA